MSRLPHFVAALSLCLLAACAAPQDLPPSAAVAQAPEVTAPAPALKPRPNAPFIASRVTAPDLNAGPAASSPPPRFDPYGLVRVALLVPLSGQAAPTGQGIVNAAQLALFEVADERLVLQVYDSKGTPEGAAEAATKALNEGAQLLLGPVFAAEVKAVTPLAQAAGVHVIGFSTDPSVAGNGVFVLGFLVEAQVREVVNYARGKGLSRFAVLAPDTVYGQSVVEALDRLVPEAGGTMIKAAYFNANGEGVEDVVRRFTEFDRRKAALQEQRNQLSAQTDEVSQLALKRLEQFETVGDVDFDAVFLPEQGSRLIQVATLLPFFEIDTARVQLLGTMLWSARGLGREPVMIGGVFPAPAVETNRDFSQRYRAAFNAVPPTLATHGFDAMALAAVLVRSGSNDPFRFNAITDPAGFAGVDGIFRFRENGLSERGFAIMQVTREGADVVQPAPSSFTERNLTY